MHLHGELFLTNYVTSSAIHFISAINGISLHIVEQLGALIEFPSISLRKHSN